MGNNTCYCNQDDMVIVREADITRKFPILGHEDDGREWFLQPNDAIFPERSQEDAPINPKASKQYKFLKGKANTMETFPSTQPIYLNAPKSDNEGLEDYDFLLGNKIIEKE